MILQLVLMLLVFFNYIGIAFNGNLDNSALFIAFPYIGTFVGKKYTMVNNLNRVVGSNSDILDKKKQLFRDLI